MKTKATIIHHFQHLLKHCAFVALVFLGSTAVCYATVLYSQIDNQGSGITSQSFPDVPTLSSQAADDFVINGQYWVINQLYIPGGVNSVQPSTYGGTVDVFFYANNGGLPGTLVANLTNQQYTDDTAGDLTINLNSPLGLGSGTYWLSVVVNNINYGAGEFWYWASRSVTTGNPAAWQNPGNGWGTGATTWEPKTTAIPTSKTPDQVFEISGTTSVPEPASMLLLGSGLVGLFGFGRKKFKK